MKKILLFLIYFGKLPNYFLLWLNAAKYNENVDFCIMSDCCFDEFDLPSNVDLVNMPFDELKEKYKVNLILKFHLITMAELVNSDRRWHTFFLKLSKVMIIGDLLNAI